MREWTIESAFFTAVLDFVQWNATYCEGENGHELWL